MLSRVKQATEEPSSKLREIERSLESRQADGDFWKTGFNNHNHAGMEEDHKNH